MKLNRLETHDRLEHLIKDQSDNLSQGLDDCINKNPLSLRLQDRAGYIYVFAHPRTAEDGVNKRMLWQPRLTKPKAQSNSYLFRVNKGQNTTEICWMIPDEMHFGQHEKGKVTQNEIVQWSIHMFKTNKEELEKPDANDASDAAIEKIYREISINKTLKKLGVYFPE